MVTIEISLALHPYSSAIVAAIMNTEIVDTLKIFFIFFKLYIQINC